MSESQRIFSPSEFSSRLIQRNLDASTGFFESLIIRGRVKAPNDADTQHEYILLNVSDNCRHWMKIPLAMVESVEELGEAVCQDHAHPYVALTFGPPTSSEASTFATIAVAAQRATFHPLAADRRRGHQRLIRANPFRRVPRRAADVPSAGAAAFGQAAHSFLSAFEAAAAGDDVAAAAWADQFQSDYAYYEACVATEYTL